MARGTVSRAAAALLLLLLQLTDNVSARATYSIVAPRVLRPNTPYTAAITILETSEPTRVTVQVGGRPDSGGNELKSKEVVVQPGFTSIVQFNIGDLGPGQYNLTAAGRGGLSFQNTTALDYVHKSYSVFIQTDKAIYKPGDLVNFRAVVLNPSLRPHTAGNLNAYVTDGKGNRIQQWDRQFTTNGVFTSSIQLSDQPVLGDWNITIDVLGQKTSKLFEVAEYVLPRFEVTVDLPPYATFADTTVTATVHAKYTYGKPVKGEVMIRAHPELKSTYIQPIFQDPVRKSAEIDGTADITFNLRDELGLTEDYERELVFDVIVTEELTGRAQNASASTTLYRHNYILQLVKTAENFKPGLKYTAFLKIATQDDKPVRGGKDKVTVKYGYSYNHEDYTATEYDVPNNGLLELTFYPPADNATHALGIEAEYKGVNQWFSTINRALSPSNTYIQASLATDEPRVGEQVTVQINSTAPVYQYVYQVLGLGRLQFAETANAGGKTSHQFRFVIRKEMVPRTRVVVYYILPDGEVVADALDFDVAGTFQNTVDIELGSTKVEPGEEVDIKIKTRPDSYVCVLGVDQAVTVLKSGNDITQADVYEEMESYDSGRRPDGLPFLERQKRSLFFWPGSSTASQVFEDSGVVVLTNAYVHESFHLTDGEEVGKRPSSRPIRPLVYSANGTELTPDQGPPIQYRPITRPPLAGPYAFFTIPPPFYHHRRVHVVRSPPSTWIFKDVPSAGTLGEARLKEKAPDTITSWIISAFSVDNLYGLGVSEKPSKLQVFRPFFVSLNLPYAVKRGEVVGIQCVVFNYHDRDLVADVTFEHKGDFEFTSFSDEQANEVEPQQNAAAPKLELFKKKQVLVPKNDGASVTFMVIPKALGPLDIKVTARTDVAGDAVQRKLLVKPEGVPQVVNKAMLVDLRDTNRFNDTVKIKMPRSFVNGSNSVEVSVIGDILGGSVGNLERLIRLPYGCGEQNMLRFVPNIVALDYLTGSGQVTAGTQARAVSNMRTGYQRELSYRRQDGSFSAFGDRDESGSTWLTAFVVRSFVQARQYIDIDPDVITMGLKFLADNQAGNGSFPEVGRVSHQPMQGGSAQGVPLTAFTLLAFIEAGETDFQSNINSAIDYLVRNIPEDPYELSVVAYALAKADHPGSRGALARLDAQAREEDDLRWWEKPLESLKNTSYWYGRPRPLDIEMTSYALLTYIERDRTTEALPILRWLILQRNDMGGFQSTQDTVVGMSALAAAAEKLQSAETDVSVRFIFGPRGKNMQVSRGNALVLQKYELPEPEVDEVEVSASGSGLAIVQVTHRYNVEVTAPDPAFYLNPKLDELSNARHIKVSACTGWEGEGESSNMAVMEIDLPSGFTVDEQSIPGLYKYRSVKRVESVEGNTKVVIYFDEISRFETCPTVLGYYTAKVARQKRSAVQVYDYYDPTRMARQFYYPIEATLCDICEGDDCDPERCKDTSSASEQSGDPDGAAVSLLHPLLLAAAVAVVVRQAAAAVAR